MGSFYTIAVTSTSEEETVDRLEGRRALVTGAARGIGRGIVERLVAEGARVVGADIDTATMEATAAELSAGGPSPRGAEVRAVTADMADPAAITALAAEAGELLGGLDIVVNNAGIQRGEGPLDQVRLEDWQLVLDVDLRAYFLLVQAALPLLAASPHARVVNIASRAHLGLPFQANYSAAKAGVLGLTRALSLELGAKGIVVNAVAPGMIDTDLVRANPNADQMIANAIAVTPVGHIGTPADVAAAVAFLASDDARFVAGEVLHVTGGRY